MLTTQHTARPNLPEPASGLAVGGINWPRLLAVAEHRGVPVGRVDEHGALRLLYTVADLDTWHTDPTTQKENAS